MKKQLVALLGLFMMVGISLNAQTQTEKKAENLWLSEATHDFGKIPQGKPVFTFFEIKSSTADSLKLEMVQAGCGCTTPEWSREPIAPGATTTVKVGYNAASEGNFEKSITIMYNQTQAKHVKISGTVWKAPQGSAPINASIQLLKQQNN